ncbi:MAG: HlyC/CorC family transporter, partial [Myxococcales bacterium]|nr:HlyC/CorC family transporter [Myxococcales bacterium]
STLDEVLACIVEAGHSRVPVFSDTIDEIVGIFYAKDLLQYFMSGADRDSFELRNFLREPVFVPVSKKVDQLLSEFRERRMHIAIAVDEFGGTAGVVTLEDIIEEFFGEIQDEHDNEEPMVVNDDTGMLVDARIRMHDLEETLDVDFPEEIDYETLGGFVSDQFQSVPQPGASFDFAGYNFSVVESAPTHVIRVRIMAVERVEESAEHESASGDSTRDTSVVA